MPSVHDTDVKSFECHELDGDGQKAKFVINADQTLRPKFEAGLVVGHHLEWQFYCDALNLVLVRKGDREFVDFDNPKRVFRAIGDGHLRFK
jgi:hypothetical protein